MSAGIYRGTGIDRPAGATAIRRPVNRSSAESRRGGETAVCLRRLRVAPLHVSQMLSSRKSRYFFFCFELYIYALSRKFPLETTFLLRATF